MYTKEGYKYSHHIQNVFNISYYQFKVKIKNTKDNQQLS